ncbi:GntR family transcriptional regulator [Defluviimonas sp. WL0002]|uniref:GntR family transcriptional regulator n=1 Tax=Albidovulum marisflavi TaxID=2984159 RepID=A0ABT2ZET2_9RHOB|nr:GntR family transcriptional regulator [Defluviimonas sp. WL0002]MCV2869605.1 GntR family transcriptional regulator [Defluviimonas sp. WL0002]
MDQKLADTILNELEELILDGTFENGERLDEVTLAKRFGVSRTPVREALQKLVLAGLVEQQPRRGAFVRQPGPVELIEMFEVMAELEASCARFAASRISDEALDELRAANQRCQAAVEANDADRYYEENEVFHKIIYRQSGNGLLEQEALRLHRRLKPFRRVQLRLRGRMRQSMAEHLEIVEALTRADANAAAEALRAHVAVQGEKFHHLAATFKTSAA